MIILLGNTMAGKKGNRQTGCSRNGKPCPNCGKVHSNMTGKNNPSNYPGVGEKISQSKKGKNHPLYGRTYIEFYGEERAKEIMSRQKKALTGPVNPWFGRHHTAESRALMSRIWKGKRVGENHWAYGKKMSPEVRKNISEGHKGVQALDKHPLWKGGISFLPYTPEFNGKLRKRIKERDSYTCQLCGIKEEECLEVLSVHHIDYNKENSNEDNLTTLCRSCNSRVNVNREEWTIFFQNLMREKILCPVS